MEDKEAMVQLVASAIEGVLQVGGRFTRAVVALLVLGLGALVQVSATLPNNFIAFEYTHGDPDWWKDIVFT